MASIKITLDHPIYDGMDITFRTPCDCSEITSLMITYVGDNGAATTQEFKLKDAHDNDIGDLSDLFASDVIIKIMLDVTHSNAYILNADTNKYIEDTMCKGSKPIVEVSEPSYKYAIPVGNDLSFAKINKIGGMSFIDGGNDGDDNLFPYPYSSSGGSDCTEVDGVVTINHDYKESDYYYINTESVKLPAGTYILDLGNSYFADSTYSMYLNSTNSGVTIEMIEAGKWRIKSSAEWDFTGISVRVSGYRTESVYPMLYLESNPITWKPRVAIPKVLRHAKVKEIKSEGKNLIDVSKALNESFVDNGDGTYTLTKHPNGYRFSAAFELNIPANSPIYYSATIIVNGLSSSVRWRGVQIQLLNGSGSTDVGTMNMNSTKTLPNGATHARLYIDGNEADGDYMTIKDIQIEIGSTKTEYKPFVGTLDTLVIPEAVQALDSYGVGISTELGDFSNHIRFTEDGRIEYVKQVQQIVLYGTEDWSTEYDKPGTVIRHYLEGFPEEMYTIFTSRADEYRQSYGISAPFTFIAKEITSAYESYIKIHYGTLSAFPSRDPSILGNIMDIDEFRAHLAELYANGTPLTIEYVLAEPIITDITHLMSSGIIKIQDGGTIIPVNEYEHDVNMSMAYYNTANKAICSDVFVGNLTGTASKAKFDEDGNSLKESRDMIIELNNIIMAMKSEIYDLKHPITKELMYTYTDNGYICTGVGCATDGNLFPYPYKSIEQSYTDGVTDEGGIILFSTGSDDINECYINTELVKFPAGTYILDLGNSNIDDVWFNSSMNPHYITTEKIENGKWRINSSIEWNFTGINIEVGRRDTQTIYPMLYREGDDVEWKTRKIFTVDSYTNIRIPEYVSGIPVIGIAKDAFKNIKVNSIMIPATVMDIEGGALYNAARTVIFMNAFNGEWETYGDMSSILDSDDVEVLYDMIHDNSIYEPCYAFQDRHINVEYEGQTHVIFSIAGEGDDHYTKDIYVMMSETEVSDAPWGAADAVIHYNSNVYNL